MMHTAYTVTWLLESNSKASYIAIIINNAAQ